MFSLHAFKKRVYGNVPIHLIGVRHEEGEYVLRREAVGGEHGLVVQGLDHIDGIDHQLPADLGGEILLAPHRTRKGQAGGRLPAVVEHAGDINAGVPRLDQITARLQVLGDFLGLEGLVQAVGALDARFVDKGGVDFVRAGFGPDIDDRLFPEIGDAVDAEPTPSLEEACAEQDGRYDAADQHFPVYFLFFLPFRRHYFLSKMVSPSRNL